MKKVLWFSRHVMSQEQYEALGHDVTVYQVSRTINSAVELQAEIDAADVVAIVAPVSLQAEFLHLAGNKPVITAVSERIVTKDPDGNEDKVQFKFLKWERLVKIEVIKEDYIP